jgi:MFS family permease
MTASAEARPAAPLPSLWRNRSFNLLWGSQTLSELGTNMSYLAFPLLVLALTGSPVKAGVVGTVAAVAKAAVRLPAGVLVDRINRRTAMLTCDAIRIVTFGGLAALVFSGRATLPAIIAAALVEAVATVVFSTAESSALRNIMPLAQLSTAVARNEARMAGAGLVGPPLGGLLFGIARGLPFLGDAISYVLSLTGIALIRDRFQERRDQPKTRALADLSEGIRFVLREPFFRAVLMVAPPLNLGFNGLLFAIILILQRSGTRPALIGLVETAVGIAALLGAVFAPAIQRRLNIRTLIMVISWSGVAMVAAAAPLSGSLAMAVPVAFSLFLAPAINSALFGYQAALTPDRLQGRVVSIVMLAALSLSAFAPILAGVTVDRLGGPSAVLVFAAVLSVGAMVATFSKGVRSMRPLDEIDQPAES